jgi:hypothetical protein
LHSFAAKNFRAVEKDGKQLGSLLGGQAVARVEWFKLQLTANVLSSPGRLFSPQ